MRAWRILLIVAALATIAVISGTFAYFNYFTKKRLFISTTTSLYDTLLLDELERDYEARHNVDPNVLAVGTGIAIQHAKNGDADIVLVHSPSVEKAFLEEGYGLNRKIIAYNFFTIIGPEDDPAGVEGKTATEAIKGIIEFGQGLADQSGQTQIWISRGDNSGTHSKEKKLWNEAGYDYELIVQEPWYASTGQGMGATLNVANQKNAYCLSDIGTYLKFYSEGIISLPALITEEQSLLNVYSVMAVNPAVTANQSFHAEISFEDAMEFIEYLILPSTQLKITQYGEVTYGQSLFTGAVESLGNNAPQPLVDWIKEYAFFEGSECPPQYRNGYSHLYS